MKEELVEVKDKKEQLLDSLKKLLHLVEKKMEDDKAKEVKKDE